MAELTIKNHDQWANQWSISDQDQDQDQDQELSKKLIDTFSSYLSNLEVKNVSKTTYKRHESACCALGGYIISQVYGYEVDGPYDNLDGITILNEYIGSDGGPLVHPREPTWQAELDTTCKKLYKFICSESPK